MLIGILCTLLSACAYVPIVDSRGHKGKEVAYRFEDDLQTCKAIAKQNTNQGVEGYKVIYNYYIRPSLLWLPDKIDFKYNKILRNCLQQRGHSVLN